MKAVNELNPLLMHVSMNTLCSSSKKKYSPLLIKIKKIKSLFLAFNLYGFYIIWHEHICCEVNYVKCIKLLQAATEVTHGSDLWVRGQLFLSWLELCLPRNIHPLYLSWNQQGNEEACSCLPQARWWRRKAYFDLQRRAWKHEMPLSGCKGGARNFFYPRL